MEHRNVRSGIQHNATHPRRDRETSSLPVYDATKNNSHSRLLTTCMSTWLGIILTIHTNLYEDAPIFNLYPLSISNMVTSIGALHFSAAAPIIALLILALLYLANLNRLLSKTPDDFKKLVPERWTRQKVEETYSRLVRDPITTSSYASQLPPKLDRRYIVTGGCCLVGGYIVLQLLERAQPPHSIWIVDFQAPHREDMLSGRATKVEFIKADIRITNSVEQAFLAPWDSSCADLPLTVFHTAAVIIPSARLELVNGFCESVNVRGTEHGLVASRKAGAGVLVMTSSGSIAIRPIQMWGKP